jgi:hypothetical protein
MGAGIICSTVLKGGEASEAAAGLHVGTDTVSSMRDVLGFSGLGFVGVCASASLPAMVASVVVLSR